MRGAGEATTQVGYVGGRVTFSMMSTLVFVLTLYYEETLGLSAAAGAYGSKVIGRFGARRTRVGSLAGQGMLTGLLRLEY